MQRGTVFPTRSFDPTDRREPPRRPAETEPGAPGGTPRAGRGSAAIARHRPTGRSVRPPEDFK
jgi:hypothetical protein